MGAVVRFAAGAVAALALLGPARAETTATPVPSPSPPSEVVRPTAVVVRLTGGIAGVNRWLSYAADGTAQDAGLHQFDGSYRSKVDFATVSRIVLDAKLCTRSVTPGRAPGLDMFTHSVMVRCGTRWRYLTQYDRSTDTDLQSVAAAIGSLTHLAASLSWRQTEETLRPPDVRVPPPPLNGTSTTPPSVPAEEPPPH